jgi:hypothetical protein
LPEIIPKMTGRSLFRGPRAALILFVALDVVALPLLLWWGRRGWFFGDDWDFLVQRKAGNLGDLFRSHYGHWTTLPILVYRLLWSVVGLRSYMPYLVLVVVAHLVVAGLLRAVMRRAGVGPWLSTLLAAVFVFFGSGAEDILVAFQITFVGAVAFGLSQLLLADHDGPVDRRDWLGLVAGFAGLLCSGVAIAMTVSVGVAVLLRRGWRMALFHTVPLAAAYLIWLSAAPKGQSTSRYTARSPREFFAFVVAGIEAVFGRLSQLPGVGLALAAVLLVGLALRYATREGPAMRGRTAGPLALLVGAVVFLAATGLVRSGRAGLFYNVKLFGLLGADRARLSRYVYVAAALTLPAIALAAQAIIRRWPRVTIAVLALLVVGIPSNVVQFGDSSYQPASLVTAVRRILLTAPRLPIARQLPRSLEPQPAVAPGVSIGWLLDNLPSGRIPSLGPLTRDQIATVTIGLALTTTSAGPPTSCRPLLRPAELVLRKGHALTVKAGAISVVYLPVGGGRSRPRQLSNTSELAHAGPLRLLLLPTSLLTQAVICS